LNKRERKKLENIVMYLKRKEDHFLTSKKGRKIYWKREKARKKAFIKHIRNNYTEFDGFFLLDLCVKYLQNLYDYYNQGYNVWSDDKSLDIKEVLDKGKKLLGDDLAYLEAGWVELLKDFFNDLSERILRWWD